MKKKPKPKPHQEALLMLKVFEACVKAKLIPQVGSPCHKKLKQIIREVRSWAK